MRRTSTQSLVILILGVLSSDPGRAGEQLPAGIRIEETDLGPVFADSNGMTLYFRDGSRGGDVPGKSVCTTKQYVTGKGPTHSPNTYGLIRQENRPTCTEKNPLAIVAEGAAPIAKWAIVPRADSVKQWMYDQRPLYRSIKDRVPRDVNGTGEPAYVPIPMIPGVQVRRDGFGQSLETVRGMSIYTYKLDKQGKSNCDNDCARTWQPLIAGAFMTVDVPDWSIVAGKDGSKQWAFRGKPLYTNVNDYAPGQRSGDGELQWAIAQIAPGVSMPPEVTTRMTWLGRVYADARGHTLYRYFCNDFSPDNLPCDDPEDRSHEWFSFCGTPEQCATTFRPILAPANAKPIGRTWTIVKIQSPWAPVAMADNSPENGIRVWAYRGRPVITFVVDEAPGKFEAIGFRPGTYYFNAFGPTGDVELR